MTAKDANKISHWSDGKSVLWTSRSIFYPPDFISHLVGDDE